MTIRDLLLTGLIAAAPGLTATDAHAKQDHPVKSAKVCNDELRANADKLEKAGITATEFFHNCWWNSKAGQPTPIAHDTRRASAPSKTVTPDQEVNPAGPEPYHAPTPTEAGIVSQTPTAPMSKPDVAAGPEPYHGVTPAEPAQPATEAQTGQAEPARMRRRAASMHVTPSARRYRVRREREREEFGASRPMRRRAPVETFAEPERPLPGRAPQPVTLLQIPDMAANIANRALAGQPVPAPEVNALVRGIVNPQIPPGVLPPPF